jgi:hypothetical protein
VQYEEQLRRARESAGAIIQAAQEASAHVGRGGGPRPAESPRPSTQELEEQVAYLKAFAQACRVQLRAYLEALLTDVESEWGRADPSSLPQAPARLPAQRSDGRSEAGQVNVAREMPMSDSTSEHPIVVPDGVVPDGVVPDGVVPDGVVPNGGAQALGH